MCTKAEVREVIKEVVTPVWARRLLGVTTALVVLFVGWLAFEMHKQDEARLEQDLLISEQLHDAAIVHAEATTQLSAKIDNIKFIFATSIAETTNRVDRLALEVNHVKDIAIKRSKDRWTGRDAKGRNDLEDARFEARNKLVDERCKSMVIADIERKAVVDRRLKEIEDTIKKLHKNESI